MSDKIKTKEVIRNIKVKDQKSDFSHYIKTSAIQTKINGMENKKEADKEQSVETKSTDQIESVGIRTSYEVIHKGNELKNTTVAKIKERKKEDKFQPLHSKSVSKTNSIKETAKNSKEAMKEERIKTIKKDSNKIKTKPSEQKISKINKVKNSTVIKDKEPYFKLMKQHSISQYIQKTYHSKTMEHTVIMAKQVAYKTIKGSIKIGKAAVNSMNMMFSAGTGLIILLVFTLFIGVFSALGNESSFVPGIEALSEEVIGYTDTIKKYAKEYDMDDYVPIIQAVMMAESGGKGKDLMQCSESGYNEKYPRVPNGITDPEYSIEIGVKTLSYSFKNANVKDSKDTKGISLALQDYNYGNGYAEWALKNFGGYTKANAKLFSDMKKQELGLDAYGNPNYVDAVMKYVGLGFGSLRSEPNFENMKAWGFNNPYSQIGLYGQCTWFAWGRFYEIYGYSPGFTGDGWDCVDQLVRTHPNKFKHSNEPVVGAVFSGIGKNHVGIVIGWDGTNVTIQDGNYDGKTNSFADAKKDWKTSTMTLAELSRRNGGVKFAVQKFY